MRRTKAQIQWELENAMKANEHLNREFQVMRNSVVEAVVRLPNVNEYISNVETEIDMARARNYLLEAENFYLRQGLTDVLHCVKLFLDSENKLA